MKIKFSCLEEGDKIWYVYNKNYKEWNYNKPYNVEYVLRQGTITYNKNIKTKIWSTDYYDESYYVVDEMKISIDTEFGTYCRSYDQFYDEKCQMTISGEIYSNNPRIEVFTIKEDAIEYIEAINLRDIKMLNEEIQNRQNQIQLCEQSIKNAKEQ